MTNLKPVIKRTTDENNLPAIEDVYYDLTILIDHEGNSRLIDNSQEDFKDFVDDNTFIIEKVKIQL